MQQIKLLSATALLTFLIWALAEQMVTGSVKLDVAIQLQVPPGSKLVVEPHADVPPFYRVTAVGRQAVVEELRNNPPAKLNVTLQDRSTGVVDLKLLEELRAGRLPELRGGTVEDVQPPSMRVTIDRFVDVPLSVRVRRGNLDYDVEPRVEPETVQVTIRESVWRDIKGADPRVEIDAERYLAGRPGGEPISLEQVPLAAALECEKEGNIRVVAIQPDSVKLRATLRHQRRRGTIQAVPIQFRASRGLLNRFDIEFRDPNPAETISVEIVGPPEMVDSLVNGARRIFAVIPLGTGDALGGGQFQFFTPEFNLPAGVELAKDFTPPMIELRLVARAPAEREVDRGP